MAFMGLMFAFVFFLIIGVLAFSMIVCFIIGLILKNKKRLLSKILLTISGVILAIFIVGTVAVLIPKPETIETPDGEVTVMSNVTKKFNTALQDKDLETVDKLTDRYPELIYYLDINKLDPLQYFADKNNVDGVKLMIEKGARFDNGLTLKHRITEYAFNDYFHSGESPTHETRKEIIELMVENGAQVNYDDAVYSETKKSSALFGVVYWAVYDGHIDEYELEAAQIVVDAGADLSMRGYEDNTPLDVFDKSDMIEDMNTNENAKKFRELLRGAKISSSGTQG